MVQEHPALNAALSAARHAALLGAVLVLAGCPSPATRPPPPPSGTPDAVVFAPAPQIAVPPPPPPQRATPPTRENRLSPTSRALVAQARAMLASGDLDDASSTLDRALRIEPNNPLLWVERGRLRLAETDPRQAEACARKALALASGDRAAQAQAGRVLADALRAQQRNQEAAAVEHQPFMQ